MIELQNLVSDAAIKTAFENTNFGRAPRDVIRESLLQYACRYHTGKTARMICEELGLVTVKSPWALPVLTEIGRQYLWAAYQPTNHQTNG